VRAIPVPIKKRGWLRVAAVAAAAIAIILVLIWLFKPSFPAGQEGYQALRTGNMAMAEKYFGELAERAGRPRFPVGWISRD